jgi:hypothetical protein
VDSNPSGASVTIDGYNCGITPQYVLLKRNQPHKVLIEKSGYQTSAHYLQPKESLATRSNPLFPIGGAALGAGICGIACVKDPVTIVLLPGFLLAGFLIGSVIAFIGDREDVHTGAGKTLGVDNIHAELHQ